MIRLVVNAEELGASPAMTQAILRAHRDGVVTSATVPGNLDTLDAVRAALAEAPGLGVGLSLRLAGGRAVAPAETVASLLAPDGALRARPAEFAAAWLKKSVVASDAERELDAQIARARKAGLVVDHLTTGSHLGFLPGLGEILERLANRHGIAGLRIAVEPPTLGWLTEPRRAVELGVLSGLAWLGRRRMGTLRHGPRTWGYLESGRLDEVRILEILGRLGPGAHELICHPGAGLPDHEGDALSSSKIKKAIADRGIVLGRWRDLF